MLLRHRLGNALRSNGLERKLYDELTFHIQERIDELVASGMHPCEARDSATRRFGNFTLQKERTRDMHIATWLENRTRDLAYGARQLRLNPGFTAVAVLSLALGIGANTAIFQLIDAIRLRSLAVSRPDQLAAIDAAPDFFASGWYSSRNRAFTYAQYEQIQKQQQAFAGLLAFNNARLNLSRGGEARYADTLFVSSNFFDVLGITPLVGHGFAGLQDRSNCGDAGAVLGYGFWQQEFAGNPGVTGRTVFLQGRTFPVSGVAPADFNGVEPGFRFDVALPLCSDSLFNSRDGQSRIDNPTAWWLAVVGRLNPGWSLVRASSHLRDISSNVFRETLPATYRTDSAAKYQKNKLTAVSASSGVSYLRKTYENPLWILLTVSGLVLLIACANLANLLLARASVRQRELAVRQALGASRSRLLGQLLSESLLLAICGALLGAFLAQVLSRATVVFLSSGNQGIHIALGVNWRVFAFTAGLALLTCLLFGLAPAIQATGNRPAAAMHGGRGTAVSQDRNRLLRSLVVCQIGISLVLLVGAMLFGRSLRNLLTVETGIVSDGVLVANVDARLSNLKPQHRRVVFRELQEKIAATPRAVSAAPVLIAPFTGSGWNDLAHADTDRTNVGGKEVWFNRVGPGYFHTLMTPLNAGRDFTPHDDESAPKVAIVNEQFAQKLFGGGNPLGRTFRTEAEAGATDPVYQIVGLVKNTKYNGLREEFRAIAFLPLEQDPDLSKQSAMENLTFVIRSQGPLSGLMAGVRQAVSELQPGLLVEFRVLDVQVAHSVLRERLMANLSGGFGLLAALLSTLGLYGVMSYMVARRRNEIGLRMALGAQPKDVLRIVFGEAGLMLVVGGAFGLAGSFALSRYAESLLFGLKPNDISTLVLSCSLLALTGLLAALVPARRAARLDPAVVLREE